MFSCCRCSCSLHLCCWKFDRSPDICKVISLRAWKKYHWNHQCSWPPPKFTPPAPTQLQRSLEGTPCLGRWNHSRLGKNPKDGVQLLSGRGGGVNCKWYVEKCGFFRVLVGWGGLVIDFLLSWFLRILFGCLPHSKQVQVYWYLWFLGIYATFWVGDMEITFPQKNGNVDFF